MKIDLEKLMQKKKKKKSSSFLGKLFGAIIFDFIGQILFFTFVIVGFMIYLYIKTWDYFFLLRKKLTSANTEIAITIKNETAFKTGVEPNLILEYRSIGMVGSEPIKNMVVLIFEKLSKNATTKAPIIAGFK